MIQLFSEGAYLVDGTTLVKESEAGALKQLVGEKVSKEDAGEKYHRISYFERSQHIRKYGKTSDQI